jgi:type II secretory pathway component GspD/PulD (secretin)
MISRRLFEVSFLAVLLLGIGLFPDYAVAATELPPARLLLAVRPEITTDQTRIHIETNGFAAFKDFALDNPSRIVVDLEGVRNQATHKPIVVGATGLQQVRVGRPMPGIVRIVFDLAAPVPYQIEREGTTLVVTVKNQIVAQPVHAPEANINSATAPQTGYQNLPPVQPALNPADNPQQPVAQPAPAPPPQLNPVEQPVIQQQQPTASTQPPSPTGIVMSAHLIPKTQLAAGDPNDSVIFFYRCRYIRSASVINMLSTLFQPDELKVIVGPEPYSPRLEQGATSSGSQVATVKSMSDTEGGGNSHDVILKGKRSAVNTALAILEKADHHRRQVRLNIKIVDIDVSKALDLGIKWNWTPNYTVSEKNNGGGLPGFFPTHFNIGTLLHSPVFINAALAAKGENDTVRLLAMPNMSLLDGERGFILIGERILFPKIVSYTAVGLPIYDKEEVRTGIYIQMAVQMSDRDDMTLSIYPQVSVIAGFLEINGSKYPEINTREEQTTVRIRDKETLVIGGLLREDEITKLSQVPGISKVPILGQFFKNRSTSKIKTDLVIMITPEIIASDEDSPESSK